jgi:hypothetical protein
MFIDCSLLLCATDAWLLSRIGLCPKQAGLAWAILSSWGWRWLVAISSVPLLMLMLLYPLLPESPYWLLATGQTGRAQALLHRIARANGRPPPKGRLLPGRLEAAEKVPPPFGPTCVRCEGNAALLQASLTSSKRLNCVGSKLRPLSQAAQLFSSAL